MTSEMESDMIMRTLRAELEAAERSRNNELVSEAEDMEPKEEITGGGKGEA